MEQTVSDWFTSDETIFLLGAGCSVCAGKPMIGPLTDKVEKALGEPVTNHLSKLSGKNGRDANIEDLINFLLRKYSLNEQLKDGDRGPESLSELNELIASIKAQIIHELSDNWLGTGYHRQFLRRTAITAKRHPRNIFLLNYDTVLEASLEAIPFPYRDGFVGAENAFFEPTVFDEPVPRNYTFNVHKMHGSINWIRDESGQVRRVPIDARTDKTGPIVVYPSEQKYVETRYGIYETMAARFRNALRYPAHNRKLVCLGYSFNDDHVNEMIIDALTSEGSTLSVFAFLGTETDQEAQEKRLTSIAQRAPTKFNAYVGRDFHIGDALDLDESKELLTKELWRFENVAEFLGGANL